VDDVIRYYQSHPEQGRLERGRDRLEFARIRGLLRRFAPPPPATVLDVGGATGAYAAWLTEAGYAVHIVDLVEEQVVEARRMAASMSPGFSASVGDARRLVEADASFDLVLLFGPLYHLAARGDRGQAWAEASRVVRPGGTVLGIVFSRWAALLDAVFRPPAEPAPGFVEIAYFHEPHEAVAEAAAAGLEVGAIVGVDGPGWLVSDFDRRWDDPAERGNLLRWAGETEDVPELLGLHAHLMVVARRLAHRG
jgi:SAM-dependent methyltransferase